MRRALLPSAMHVARNAGFTLIELMVSMVIGLFIAGGLIAIVVTSTSAYNVQLDHARVNENARFAVEFLSRDVRMAGYYGCLDNPANVINNLNAGAGTLYDIADAIEGFEGNAGETAWQPSGTAVSGLNILAGTDAITVRFANPTESARLDNESSPDSPIPGGDPANGHYEFSAGQVAVVSDCDKADVFQITGTDDDNNLAHAGGGSGTPGNSSGSLGGGLGDGYDTFATVMTYNAVRYFVRRKDTSDTDANAPVALYREYISGSGATTVEEVIEGVENMQVLYGVDTDADGVANSYQTAANVGGQWRNVVSVQVALLVRSNDEYGLDFESSAATHDLLGQTITDADDLRVRRRKYTTTIALRNGQ